ncbi:MAG TPA: hypothetical protein VI731_05450 [Bacteroidia bacterium]|nr:hypothetical protein [Bacteroidia bacterium]
MKKFLFFLLIPIQVSAQHQHSQPVQGDTAELMTSAFSRNLPMTRNGSGTSWLPDASPAWGHMFHRNQWMFMAHYNAFLRYNHQDFLERGTRGGKKIDFLEWGMLKGQREIGVNGLFHFSTMFTLDPFFVGSEGYPLLFQTGETWQGKQLVDRQHPHELFSELAVSYAHSFGSKTDGFIYAGFPGEPALGSGAFMHRPSAMFNPDAPITHHWNDGHHITFGVLTFGLRYSAFKLETSAFHGREPDENRYDFDGGPLDSWSMRLSFSPREDAVFQVSHGFINSPDVLDPVEDVARTTASVIFTHNWEHGKAKEFYGTLLWARNVTGRTIENATLAEGVLAMRVLSIYSRYELVQKTAEHLNLISEFPENLLIEIHEFTAGMSIQFLKTRWFNASFGSHLTLFISDHELFPIYGEWPWSFEAYLRIYPPRLNLPTFRK